ncbi:MAG: transcription termination factor Rho [Isosphaeraceae bacterium]
MSTPENHASGVLEMNPRGNGFLRDPSRNLRPAQGDVVVSNGVIERYQLRPGVLVTGPVDRPSRPAEGPRLVEPASLEGMNARDYRDLKSFEERTAVDPCQPFRLETASEPLGTRVMDLLTPIGKGQRGLIVAPPRTGKTILLQQVAAAVTANHPEVALIVLLVDERPEEVTEMRRSIRGQVFSSSNDHTPEEHIRIAELTVDRGKRIAESGGHALILLDSLTRLARAYNKGSNSGRTMSGGMDIKAMDVPKRLFGAARAFEEGGSLTILATALIETGSRMDDLIFQEFKGTGNMELVLDRKLADRRVWPAIDLQQSGTRKEERLLDPLTLSRVTLLRRSLSDLKPVDAMESLVRQVAKFPTNTAFLERIGQFLKPD